MSLSGCGGQPGLGEAFIDVLFDNAQGAAKLGRGLWLASGDSGARTRSWTLV
jgi:hypothetical protein